MLTKAAGPDWRADAEDELDLPLEVAARLVSGGYAVALEKAAPAPVPKPEPETAMVEPEAERAVVPKPKAKAKPKGAK